LSQRRSSLERSQKSPRELPPLPTTLTISPNSAPNKKNNISLRPLRTSAQSVSAAPYKTQPHHHRRPLPLIPLTYRHLQSSFVSCHLFIRSFIFFNLSRSINTNRNESEMFVNDTKNFFSL
jgi:hypothetical protein